MRDHSINWPELEEKLASPMDMGDHDGEWIAEFGGRLCYMSFGRGRNHQDHLEHVIGVGHGSVLEHTVFNVVLWQVSRSLTHELVRHRIGVGYSQLSQRYVDESEVGFVVPPAIRALESKNPDLHRRWSEHMTASRDLYCDLVDGLGEMYADIADKTERRKKARQAARSVLPNATETKILVTANARAWRHMIEMRAHPAADLEIRELFVEVFRTLQKAAPYLFFDMRVVTLPDGTEGVESDHRKI